MWASLALLVYGALRLGGLREAEDEHRRAMDWAVKRQREQDFERAVQQGKGKRGGE